MKKKKDYTTITISWQNRVLLDDVKKYLTIEKGNRFISMNEIISWLLGEAGF